MAGTETPTREAVDAAHEALPPIPGQTDLAGELRGEAGEPTGDVEAQLAAGRQEPPAPPVEGLQVRGTSQLSMFDMGGKQPLSGVLAVKAVKVPLADGTAFKKGTTMVLEVVAVVEEVAQKDKVDKATGIVIECEQKHSAKVTDVRIKETS